MAQAGHGLQVTRTPSCPIPQNNQSGNPCRHPRQTVSALCFYTFIYYRDEIPSTFRPVISAMSSMATPLPFILNNTVQCLPRSHARHLGRVYSVSSKFSCPCLAPPLARVFRILLPVITLLRGSSSLCSHAGHHFALMLGFTGEEISEVGSKIRKKGE